MNYEKDKKNNHLKEENNNTESGSVTGASKNDDALPLKKLKIKKLNDNPLDINDAVFGVAKSEEQQPLKKLNLKRLDDNPNHIDNNIINKKEEVNNSIVDNGFLSHNVTKNHESANNIVLDETKQFSLEEAPLEKEPQQSSTEDSFVRLSQNIDKLQHVSKIDISNINLENDAKVTNINSSDSRENLLQEDIVLQKQDVKQNSNVEEKIVINEDNYKAESIIAKSNDNDSNNNDNKVAIDFGKSFHQELTSNVTNDILSNVKSDLIISHDDSIEETPQNNATVNYETSVQNYKNIENTNNTEASSLKTHLPISENKENIVSTNVSNNILETSSVVKETTASTKASFSAKGNILAKITPKKISSSELQNIQNNKSQSNANYQVIEEDAVVGSKKNKKLKLKAKQKDKIVEKTAEVEKVDKVLQDVALLFKPFKDILLKTLPFLKPVINFIDKLAIFVGKIARVIMIKIPIFIKFLKSRSLRVIIYICIALFLFGIFVSRAINSSGYVKSLEDAIYDTSGYRVSINGIIKVRIFPYPGISIKNIFLYKAQNDNSALESRLAQISAENLVINFKILPMFWGNFEIDKVSISKAVVDVAVNNNPLMSEMNNVYENIIKNIDKQATFKVATNKKVVEKKVENNIDLLKKIDTVINLNDNSDKQLTLEEELQNDIITDNLPEDSLEESNNNENSDTADSSNNIGESETIEQNSNEQNSDNNQEVATALVESPQDNNIVKANSSGSGFIYNIFAQIVKNVNFDLKNINNIDVVRSRVNIVAENTIIASVENISGTINNGFFSEPSSEGKFRFMNNNAFYKLKLNYDKDDINFDFKVNFTSETADNLNIIGKRLKNGVINAKITTSGDADLLFINHFIFPVNIQEVNNHNFSADLFLGNGLFAIDNINLSLNNDAYSGNFKWNLSKNINNASLNLKVKTDNLNSYMKTYERLSSQKINSYNSSNFDSFVETINNWKNNTIDNFKFQYFQFKIEVEPTKLNAIDIDKTNINLLFDNKGRIYIESLSIDSKVINSNLVGRIDLNKNNAMLLLNSKGLLKDSTNLIGVSSLGQDFILKIANDEDSYNLKTKLVINNNKFVFNEINGFLGNREINNSYLVFLKRIGNTDVLISSNLKSLQFNELINLYKYQTSKIKNVEDSNIDLFGIDNNFKININLNIDKFSYKDLLFNKANIEIALNKAGIVVKKFEANGQYGGSVVASFVGDGNVLPVVAGHLNLNNYVLKLEETSGFMFNGKKVIGDLYLNGRFKFSGDTYEEPFASLDGELTFVKYERIKLNRFANTNGLYFTLSEKKQGKQTNYLVNDAYGKVTINNGVLDFYPVVMLYIYNNKEYRGTFSGSYNFGSNIVSLKGMVDNANNINNQMEFSINGNLLNPDYKRKFSQNKTRSNVGIKRKVNRKPLDSSAYVIANKLNNKEDKNNFNNTYNKNTSDEEKYLRDNLYQDALENSLYGNNEGNTFKDNYPTSRK